MILFWFYFNGLSNIFIRINIYVTGDWSQSMKFLKLCVTIWSVGVLTCIFFFQIIQRCKCSPWQRVPVDSLMDNLLVSHTDHHQPTKHSIHPDQRLMPSIVTQPILLQLRPHTHSSMTTTAFICIAFVFILSFINPSNLSHHFHSSSCLSTSSMQLVIILKLLYWQKLKQTKLVALEVMLYLESGDL